MTDLRKYAKGKPCQIRIPGVCNGDPETTVLCHVHKPSISGGGMGKKGYDLLAAHGCNDCHDMVDGRGDSKIMMSRQERDILLYEGVLRTQKLLIEEGII